MLVVAALAASAGRAHASPESDARLAEAERAERDLRLADALQLYREALALDLTSPRAPRARVRADELASRAEGGFAPLARLERVRRDATLTASAAQIDALARDVEGFVPGRVRTEARLFVAAARERLGDLDGADVARTLVVADRDADRISRGLALQQVVTHRLAVGDPRGAARVVALAPEVAPPVTLRVARAVRRVTVGRVAVGALAAFASVGLVNVARLASRLGARGLRSKLVRPLPLMFALWVAGGGAALVHLYDGSTARPFVALGVGVVLADLAARAWALGGWPRVPAWSRAVSAIVAVAAVAWCALAVSDTAYLESFGL